MFHLSWVAKWTDRVSSIRVRDQDEAQYLFANLRGRTEIVGATLYFVVGDDYELVEKF